MINPNLSSTVSGEKPYTILQQWGSYAPEVQFYLRHIAGSAGALMDRSSNWNNEQSMLNVNQGNLSLAELKVPVTDDLTTIHQVNTTVLWLKIEYSMYVLMIKLANTFLEVGNAYYGFCQEVRRG